MVSREWDGFLKADVGHVISSCEDDLVEQHPSKF